ncbi:MAG TPA: CapA family protein [Desulfomonilia bacterium]
MLRYLLIVAALAGGKLLDNKLKYSRELPDIKQWSFTDYLYSILKAWRPVVRAQKDKGIEQFFKAQDLDFLKDCRTETASKATLSFGGDIIDWVEIEKESRNHLWDEIGEYYFSGDIVCANLEMPIDTEKPPRKPFDLKSIKLDRSLFKAPKFNGSSLTLDALQRNGRRPDILSTATNHCLNMEESGVTNTLGLLDERGIRHVGTARTHEEQEDIPIIERNGIKVAFLAYTYSINQDMVPEGKEYLVNIVQLNEKNADISIIRRHIGIARSKGADIIVASLHWGYDQEVYPTASIIDNAHEIIQAGVDIIIGHHPHILQPLEKYICLDPVNGKKRTGLIAYSLGEFLSYPPYSYPLSPIPAVWLSAVFCIEISKGHSGSGFQTWISGVKLRPFYKLGRKTGRGSYSVRFIDLRKTLNGLITAAGHYRLSIRDINKIARANAYLEEFIYPADNDSILESL